jgi:toxin ParE1/3/4
MKDVIWRPIALAEYKAALAFAAKEHLVYADLISERIIKAITLLTKINVGRNGRISGTFEKSVYKTPYIISYLDEGNKVVILHIIYTSKK